MKVAVVVPALPSVTGVASLTEMPGAMVKLALEMSKKMFATASTFTRAVVVEMFGNVTASLPSFGVLASSTVGKVCRRRWTADLDVRGDRVVLATFQVTVWVAPAAQLTAVLGAVTAKGPDGR